MCNFRTIKIGSVTYTTLTIHKNKVVGGCMSMVSCGFVIQTLTIQDLVSHLDSKVWLWEHLH